MFNAEKTELLMDFYKQKRFGDLHYHILMALEKFNKKVYVQVNDVFVKEIDRFLELLFYFLEQKDFRLGRFVENYFYFSTLIENLAFLSSYKSTEQIFMKLHKTDGQELQKKLLVHNLKGFIDLQFIDSVFMHNSPLGSYWLYSVFARHSFSNDTVMMNLRMLQEKLLNYDLFPFHNMMSVYFNATYINPNNQLDVRKKINYAIRKYLFLPPVNNTSGCNKRPKVGVVSKNWKREHAVYKCIGSFIESLQDHFSLSLICFDKPVKKNNNGCFSEYIYINTKGNVIDYTPLSTNTFDMIIFPDVGLNIESLILSNVRIAPVQVAMYGHPVSTGSDTIDYFIVGELTEENESSRYYTENVLPVCGTGMHSIQPDIKRPSLEDKLSALVGKTIHIFVAASPPKINPPIKQYWKKILEKASKPVMFHFMPGDFCFQEMTVMRHELELYFPPATVAVHRHLDYTSYMHIITCCDIALGSFHYGDYNRVVDALWVGTPIVVVRGECGYQNTGTGALRALGLDELIAHDLNEYVDLTLELIDDDTKRLLFQKKILTKDIDTVLIHNTECLNDFTSKINSLINH